MHSSTTRMSTSGSGRPALQRRSICASSGNARDGRSSWARVSTGPVSDIPYPPKTSMPRSMAARASPAGIAEPPTTIFQPLRSTLGSDGVRQQHVQNRRNAVREGDALPLDEPEQSLRLVAPGIDLLDAEHGGDEGHAPAVDVEHRGDGHVHVVAVQPGVAASARESSEDPQGVQHELAMGVPDPPSDRPSCPSCRTWLPVSARRALEIRTRRLHRLPRASAMHDRPRTSMPRSRRRGASPPGSPSLTRTRMGARSNRSPICSISGMKSSCTRITSSSAWLMVYRICSGESLTLMVCSTAPIIGIAKKHLEVARRIPVHHPRPWRRA